MDSDIELRHLRYFVAVAEELHFGRASKRLNIAQPPLSHQIRQLESRLGYPLLLRTSRSVALTSAGDSFLEKARRTLLNVSRDIDEVRSIGRGEVGSLHIGFIGSGMLTTLPSIFRSYREAYPRVLLHLHESFTSKVIQGLENGELDIGILRDGDPVEDLRAVSILSEPFVAVIPATHRFAKKRSISPADLRNEPFVHYPRSAGARAFEKPLTICEEHGFRPRIVQEASHWLTILRLVGAGFGVSIAPACVRRLVSEDVMCLPLKGTRTLSHIELAWHVGESRPLVARFNSIAQSRELPQISGTASLPSAVP
jgi:DNA-binding transcriptional LysR family regulator